MATTETEVNSDATSTSVAVAQTTGNSSLSAKLVWLIDQLLRLLSSVRFGIVMLSLLLLCSMAGMLIMQKDVEGFEQYYASLQPAKRLIYTKLNLFDIYHSRYFTFLLAITALNIILASIDRFPTAWSYIVNPKRKASPRFTQAQPFTAEMTSSVAAPSLASRLAATWLAHREIQSSITVARLSVAGLYLTSFAFCYFLFERTVSFWIVAAISVALVLAFILFALRFEVRTLEDNGRHIVFAQLNAWNRLGAYVVHVALMLIFIGGFLTNWYGVGGSMEILPGATASSFIKMEMTVEGPKLERVQLPFEVECTDLQQKLIRPEGGLEATNTIDWLSYITVKDKQSGEAQAALVHLNNPKDYKGFRFFQSKFTAFGYARSITVRFEPTRGGAPQTVTIPRNGAVDIPGIGNVAYKEFYPDFEINKNGPRSASPDYHNPAAHLEITGADGKPRTAFAFNPELAEKFLSDGGSGQEEKGKRGRGKEENRSQKEPTTDHRPPTTADEDREALLVNGYKPILATFEKAAMGHTLTLQYDPGRTPAYLGFLLLVVALCSVFFFAHQRLWAVIEPQENGSKVYFGGNTNRNRPAFEGRFNSIVDSVKGEKG